MRRDSIVALDRVLRSIRFEPRPSLEAQIFLRSRRLRREPSRAPRFLLPWVTFLVSMSALGAAIYFFWLHLVTVAM